MTATTSALFYPDEFSTPMVDKCEAIIVKARTVVTRFDPRPKDGEEATMGVPNIAAAIWFVPNEDSGYGPIMRTYSIGDLEIHQPSKDGVTAVKPDGSDALNVHWEKLDDPSSGEGYYALGTAKISPNCWFATFISILIKSGFPVERIMSTEYLSERGSDIRYLEGVKGFVDRLTLDDSAVEYARQKFVERGGKVADFKPKAELMFTRFDDVVDVSDMQPVVEGGSPATSADSDEVASKLDRLILAELKSNKGGFPWTAGINMINQSDELGRDEKGVAMSLISEDAFFEGRVYGKVGDDIVKR